MYDACSLIYEYYYAGKYVKMIEYYPYLIESLIELYFYARIILNQRASSEVLPPLDLSKLALAKSFRIELYKDSYYFCVPIGKTVEERIKEKLK